MKTYVVLLAFVVVSLVGLSDAAVSYNIGACPGGRKSGDIWYTGKCEKCVCGEGTYSCSGCGVYALDIDKTKCYSYRDIEAAYPTCCEPIVKCEGDEGFDPTRLTQG